MLQTNMKIGNIHNTKKTELNGLKHHLKRHTTNDKGPEGRRSAPGSRRNCKGFSPTRKSMDTWTILCFYNWPRRIHSWTSQLCGRACLWLVPSSRSHIVSRCIRWSFGDRWKIIIGWKFGGKLFEGVSVGWWGKLKW